MKMKKIILLLILSLECILQNNCFAQQPGDLDNSFGVGGKAVIANAPWMDIAVQTDGKIVVVSSIIARYKPNGTLDSTFGSNGIDSIKIGLTSDFICNAICIQTDGKILIVGGTVNGTVKDFLLIRYNTDGSPDSSFGMYGVTLTDFTSGSDDHGYELAIQTDGKIVVSGASNQKLALSRYKTNGSLDSTFNYDGKLTINNIGVDLNNNWSHPTYMKLQTNGKILVGSASFMIRLNPDGSLDNGFGSNGTIVLPKPMNDLAVQLDGKIILAGGATDFAIVRLDTLGNLDNSFGNGGITTTHWNNSNCSNPGQKATSIVLQPDGRILAGGYNWCCILGDCREFVLMRYNEDGNADSSFNSDGKLTTSFSQFSSESHAAAITPDLKIILAGYSYNLDYGGLAKYHLGPMLNVYSILSTDDGFCAYPNPTADIVNIDATKIENGIWHLEICDLAGRALLHETIKVTNSSIQKKVSFNSFPNGIYLLKLDNRKKKTIVRRVVKSK